MIADPDTGDNKTLHYCYICKKKADAFDNFVQYYDSVLQYLILQEEEEQQKYG